MGDACDLSHVPIASRREIPFHGTPNDRLRIPIDDRQTVHLPRRPLLINERAPRIDLPINLRFSIKGEIDANEVVETHFVRAETFMVDTRKYNFHIHRIFISNNAVH